MGPGNSYWLRLRHTRAAQLPGRSLAPTSTALRGAVSAATFCFDASRFNERPFVVTRPVGRAYSGYQLGLRFSRKLAMPSIASGVFGLCGARCARMAEGGGEANGAAASFS